MKKTRTKVVAALAAVFLLAQATTGTAGRRPTPAEIEEAQTNGLPVPTEIPTTKPSPAAGAPTGSGASTAAASEVGRLSPLLQQQKETLQRCLADFDGIQWQLPFMPAINIHSCISPAASYQHPMTGNVVAGMRRLDLIGTLAMPSTEMSHLSDSERKAAVYDAVFRHFEMLLGKHGYRSTSVDYGDAQNYRGPTSYEEPPPKYYADLQRKLDGPRPPPSTKPPIPYVRKAVFVRMKGSGETRLVYEVDMANTWIMTLEGLQP